jgi:uncharacterized protein (DUF427 family)
MASDLPESIRAARAQWHWRGQARPHFAAAPGPGQVSVWDFPRPPRLAPDAREVVVRWGDVDVARTRRAVLVLETAHPPSVYLPWADVARHLLEPAGGGSFCEWKGPARYWTLVQDGRRLSRVAWSYPQPLAGAEALADCVAFYPAALDCRVDGAAVTPQPGGLLWRLDHARAGRPFQGRARQRALVANPSTRDCHIDARAQRRLRATMFRGIRSMVQRSASQISLRRRNHGVNGAL